MCVYSGIIPASCFNGTEYVLQKRDPDEILVVRSSLCRVSPLMNKSAYIKQVTFHSEQKSPA